MKQKNVEVKNTDSEERRCYRCGKPTSELEPFEMEDGSDGPLLIGIHREIEGQPDNQELEDILQKMPDSYDEAVQLFGLEKVQQAISYDTSRGNIEKSWECRDCVKEEGFWRLHPIVREQFRKLSL